MNKIYFLLISLFILSCQDKDELPQPQPIPHPAMSFTDLSGKEVKRTQSQLLDVDNDGQADFAFFVYHIGDPIYKRDKIRFSFGSTIHSLLLTDPNNISSVLDKDAVIPIGHQLPYEWWEISEAELAQRIIEEDNSTYWEGNWQDANHKFIAIQVKKDNGRYNGWVELSFVKDQEKIILHGCAISLEAGKAVKAGIK